MSDDKEYMRTERLDESTLLWRPLTREELTEKARKLELENRRLQALNVTGTFTSEDLSLAIDEVAFVIKSTDLLSKEADIMDGDKYNLYLVKLPKDP